MQAEQCQAGGQVFATPKVKHPLQMGPLSHYEESLGCTVELPDEFWHGGNLALREQGNKQVGVSREKPAGKHCSSVS